MFRRPRAPLDILSISALDLFASALGTFMLLCLVIFPYYLRLPGLEAGKKAAGGELAAASAGLKEAEKRRAEATDAAAKASSEVDDARRRLAAAQQAAAAAEEAAAQAAARAAEAAAIPAPTPAPPTPPPAARGQRPGGLAIDDLDLVFVMDVTGSMKSELADVQANLLGMVHILSRLSPRLRVGFVAYRDVGEAFVTRAFPLSTMGASEMRQIEGFVRSLSAEGGGDDPEAVDAALADAVAMNWRNNAQGQIIVIGDAPVHAANRGRTLTLARVFHASSPNSQFPRRVSTILTGGDPAAASFFAELASNGGGETAPHQGQMIESVLLTVLRGAAGSGVRR